jgi:hypothetical protein
MKHRFDPDPFDLQPNPRCLVCGLKENVRTVHFQEEEGDE